MRTCRFLDPVRSSDCGQPSITISNCRQLPLTSINAPSRCLTFDFLMSAGDQNLPEEKKKFLDGLCRARGGTCELRETHMSWLFLGTDRVYKLKKPVRYPFLDFSSIEKRHYFCLEELRLNRRLAEKTYLSVIPICRNTEVSLRNGENAAIDWAVEMLRLSDCDMLDHRMQAASVGFDEIAALGVRLSQFYRGLSSEAVSAERQLAHISERLDIDAAVLCRQEFGLSELLLPLLSKVQEEFRECMPELCRRIVSGWFREGHGDLRPEHVWLGQPLQIIDCLEFNRTMRIVDPYEEVAQFGMECDVAGYPWIGRLLSTTVAAVLGSDPTARLMQFYIASKALLRARLCMAHLLEHAPRTPSKWRPLALKYIAAANRSFRDPGGQSIQ